MEPGDPKQTQATISAFASTHCATCAYGWTRRGTDKAGREVLSIWCLLDRGAVWEQMTSYDRYELREPSDM
jgi:hypothetical protein